MRKKVKFLVIFSAALLSIASFVILMSCGVNVGEILEGLTSIWDTYGANQPTNLQAKALTENMVMLTWWDPINGEDGFEIHRTTLAEGKFSLLTKVPANEESFLDTDLIPETIYMYKVYAYDSTGKSSPTDIVLVETKQAPAAPPSAPTNFQATPISDTRIDLSWDDNSSDEEGFKIQIDDGSGFIDLTTVVPDTTEYSSTGLSAETPYTYRVFAYNSQGDSDYAEVDATTLQTPEQKPAAPTGLIATAVSYTQIDLQWTDNSDNEEGFLIYRSTDGVRFANIDKVKPNTTKYASGSLSAATTYYYKVSAFNAQGSSDFSNTAKAKTEDKPTSEKPPAAPANLIATPQSDTAIDLLWDDKSDNEDGFNIEISTDGVNFKYVDAVKTNITTYTCTGLKPSTVYSFRINAFNFFGKSEYSNVAEGQTKDTALQPPAAPSLEAGAISDTQVKLVWVDKSDNEDGFNIYYKLDGSLLKPIFVAAVRPDVTTYTVGGLKDSTTYGFYVYSYNKAGSSASNYATAKTYPPAETKPNPPANLKAVPVSDTQIDLYWEDTSDNEAGFYVYRSDDGGKTYNNIATLRADTTYYQSTGLKPSTKYYYGVAAFNKFGNAESNAAYATTNEPPLQKPAAPTSLTATAVSDTAVNLVWTDNSDNEEGFKIYYRKYSVIPVKFSLYGSVGSDVEKATVSGLVASTKYDFMVSAYNGAGSADSNTASATTKATPTAPAAPTSLAASAVSTSQIDLTWTDNSNNEDGFKIYYRKTDLLAKFGYYGSVGVNATKASVTGLASDTEYEFEVFSYNSVGSTVSTNTAKATTKKPALTPPSAPTNLAGSYNSLLRSVSLGWDHDGVNVTGFIILGSTTGGKDPAEWTELMRVEGTVRTARVTNIIGKTGGYYIVVAYNKAGQTTAERPIFVSYGK